MVVLGQRMHLGFTIQAAERGRKNNAIVVFIEGSAAGFQIQRTLRLAKAGGRQQFVPVHRCRHDRFLIGKITMRRSISAASAWLQHRQQAAFGNAIKHKLHRQCAQQYPHHPGNRFSCVAASTLTRVSSIPTPSMANTVNCSSRWPFVCAINKISAPMVPGPAINGSASGNTDTSRLPMASSSSSAVGLLAEEL